MESLLTQFLTQGVFAFLLVFTRMGAAITIMPGVGDSFTPANIRLYIALGLSLVLTPVVIHHVPSPIPVFPLLFTLIIIEFIIGLFFGTLARLLMAALDTAGMVISLASGLGNAQLFNPGFATQGSLVGAFLSVTGVVLLFAANLHHMLFFGLVGTYEAFPIGDVPDTGSMAELVSTTLAASFAVGVKMAAPFLIVSMMVYIGMGVLSRLMPQVQVFLLALPMQILLSLLTLAIVLPALFLYWLSQFEAGMIFFLGG